jgi:hypothetical protein
MVLELGFRGLGLMVFRYACVYMCMSLHTSRGICNLTFNI